MPTGGVKNRTFKELLNGPVRFEIPFFQRGYAWEKKQWDQLFLDLNEQIIEELTNGAALKDVEHFFGPFVVLEKTGDPAAIGPPARLAEPIAAGPIPVNAGPGQKAQLKGACPTKISCAKAS